MSVIGRLRQNNPARTRIVINLRDETSSDADLAEALEQNPFITVINLILRGSQRADWNSLLRVITMCAILEKVALQDAYSVEERNTSADLVRSILRAIQRNDSIRCVHLAWLRLPTDFSSFVDNASSITSLSIYNCDMKPSEREQGARDLAAALQRNTNINTLKLDTLDTVCISSILQGLRSNTYVESFIFSYPDVSDEISHAMQQLLESTTSIRRLELAAISREMLGLIAQAITSSENVFELKFTWCGFTNRDSIAQFQSILQNKRNLTSLCLHSCDFSGGHIHGDIIAALSRPSSLLRCFEFRCRDSLEGEFPGIHFETLLRALKESNLERFSIGYIQSHQQFQTLTQSIPLMKLKELEVVFDAEEVEFDRETTKQDLLDAVEKNFSLRSVKGEMYDDESNLFESAEDKQTLAFYANRNECLDQWVDNPETVDQKVWPDALKLAERAGPEALFRGLRSVLGRDYVSLPSGKKRKRLHN